MQLTFGAKNRKPARGVAADMRRKAKRALAGAVKAGALAYDRGRDLPGLIRFDPLADPLDTATETILARLERALRAERTRARSGHWTYDLNRHIALRQAYVAEKEKLAKLRRAGSR
jgi:hypothetical protein